MKKFLWSPACHVFIVLLLNANHSMAQVVTIVKRDSTHFAAQLSRCTNTHMFTSLGNFKLNVVSSVRFLRKDAEKANFYAPNLRLSGITVWIDNERLDPLAPYLTDDELDSLADTKSAKRDSIRDIVVPHGSIGVGLGLDYGGFGARGTFYLTPHIDLFIAAGYAIADLGTNAGLIFQIAPKAMVHPTFSIMYGYNTALIIVGAPQLDKLYYGASAGVGIKIRVARVHNIHFSLILPRRPPEYFADTGPLRVTYSIQAPPDFLFSIGVLFGFRHKK